MSEEVSKEEVSKEEVSKEEVSKEEFYKQEVFQLLSPIFSDQFDNQQIDVIKEIFLGSKMDQKELIRKILGRDEN